MEKYSELLEKAAALLRQLGYRNINAKADDEDEVRKNNVKTIDEQEFEKMLKK